MPAPHARRIRPRLGATVADDRGFSMLEVVVSFVLFAIVAAGAATGIVSAIKASHTSQQRVNAANMAQQDIARVLAAYDAGTVPSESTYTASVTNEEFSVHRTVGYVDSSGADDTAATTCGTGIAFKVHVVVSQTQSSKVLARSDTVIAC
jgi:prepilin-type N-terminal cleavage/methylation domain-containing protein